MVVLRPDPVEDFGFSTGYEQMQSYNGILNQQADEVRIYGVHVTAVVPKVRTMEGYEPELNKNQDNYNYFDVKAFVDLQPRRSVFYKFNWIPEDADKMTAITFHPSTAVFADTFVRTSVAGNPSPFGDLLFKIVRVFDDGKYQVLRRVCFALPMTDQQTWGMLFPSESVR
jgi:hypothetical protein